jgi:alkylhydroperoxidase family enzyme
MRLEPIEKPRGLLNRIAYWMARRERAALAYAREAGGGAHVSDPTFERLRKHFDEREIVDITAMIAVERFYNGVAIPLGLEADGLCAIQLDRKGIAAA